MHADWRFGSSEYVSSVKQCEKKSPILYCFTLNFSMYLPVHTAWQHRRKETPTTLLRQPEIMQTGTQFSISRPGTRSRTRLRTEKYFLVVLEQSDCLACFHCRPESQKTLCCTYGGHTHRTATTDRVVQYLEVTPNEHGVWMSSDISISGKRLAKYTALMRTVRKTLENFKIWREEFHLL